MISQAVLHEGTITRMRGVWIGLYTNFSIEGKETRLMTLRHCSGPGEKDSRLDKAGPLNNIPINVLIIGPIWILGWKKAVLRPGGLYNIDKWIEISEIYQAS